MLRRRPRRPGDAHPRRKIQVAADIVLVLVTQTIAERHVRPVTPVILCEAAKIELADGRQGVAAIDRELSGAAALQANRSASQVISDTLFSNLKCLDTRQPL